jgi:nicotinate phosphoribosyltransferase
MDKNGSAVADVLGIDGEDEPREGERWCFWHPSADYRHFYHEIDAPPQALLKKRISKGEITAALPTLAEIKNNTAASLDSFDSTYKRLLNPHIYKVSITEKLRNLKLELIQKLLGNKQ